MTVAVGRELDLLLRLCLGRAGQAVDATSTAGPPVAWDRVLALADRHRVKGLIAQPIAAAAAESWPNPVPEPMITQLDAARRGLVLTSLQQTGETLRLTRLLQSAGHDSLVLKGCTLAQLYYAPNPYLRHSVDLDLLVGAEAFSEVGHLLHAEGYRRRTPSADLPAGADSMARYLLNAFEFVHPATGLKVELHHRLLSDPHVLDIPFGTLMARSVEIAVGNGTLRTLGGADLTVYLCCHGARHGFFRIKWLVDIARVCDTIGSDGIAETLERARELDCTRHVLLSLVLLDRLSGRKTAPSGCAEDPLLSRLADDAIKAMVRPERHDTRFYFSDIPDDLRELEYGLRLSRSWRSRGFQMLKHLVNHKDLETLRLGAEWTWLYALLGRPMSLMRWMKRGRA